MWAVRTHPWRRVSPDTESYRAAVSEKASLTQARLWLYNSGMLDARSVRHFNYALLALALFAAFTGLAMVHSASASSQGHSPLLIRQIIWLVLGLAVVIFLLYFDYEFLKGISWPIYVANLILLILVLIPGLGQSRGGSQRWLVLGPLNFQPSELAKLLVIITLAAFLALRGEEVTQLRVVWKSFLHLSPFLLLVFVQPDLSTSLVFVCIWFGMLLAAGARWSHLLLFLLAGVLLFFLAWHLNLIRPHQKDRVHVLLQPEEEKNDTAYQSQQSMIAIGSGQLHGKGFRRGTQSRLNFVPEQSTDFVLTVVGEEWGFLGTSALLALYAGIVFLALNIAAHARDLFGALMATGILCVFGFHVFVNVGMTTGLLPVAGLPLPFLSYGGSNLLLNMICIGLLSSIQMRRHKIRF